MRVFTAIINDCRDENAMARQAARAASLFGGSVSTIGVKSDLEAAGCLVDILDAIGGKDETLVLVNVAPRHGKAKKWPNGSPFGHFYYRHTLVLASIDGLTLSLAKKLGCLTEINLFDTPAVTKFMANGGVITKEAADRIAGSQFRSFDFLPYAAQCLLKNIRLPSEKLPVDTLIPDPPKAVWYIDCFGNVKTTILPEEIEFSPGAVIETRVGPLTCYRNLADVPDNRVGLVIGSSGIGNKRFLEIVMQGGRAVEKVGLTDLRVGQVIL